MLFKGLLSLMFTCNYIEECKNQTFAEKYKTTALLALTANSAAVLQKSGCCLSHPAAHRYNVLFVSE